MTLTFYHLKAISLKNSAICGKKINATDTLKRIKIKGGVPLITSRYGLLNTAIAVKISHPNGGVAEPIATCNVIIVPTKTGSRPTAFTTGAKIGTKTKITTIGSTNIQPTKKAIEITAKTPYGPISLIPIELNISCGTCA